MCERGKSKHTLFPILSSGPMLDRLHDFHIASAGHQCVTCHRRAACQAVQTPRWRGRGGRWGRWWTSWSSSETPPGSLETPSTLRATTYHSNKLHAQNVTWLRAIDAPIHVMTTADVYWMKIAFFFCLSNTDRSYRVVSRTRLSIYQSENIETRFDSEPLLSTWIRSKLLRTLQYLHSSKVYFNAMLNKAVVLKLSTPFNGNNHFWEKHGPLLNATVGKFLATGAES